MKQKKTQGVYCHFDTILSGKGGQTKYPTYRLIDDN